MVGHAEQAVGVGWKIDAGDFGALVGDEIEEAGILMGKSVVILPPDQRGDEQVERRDRGTPAKLEFALLQPFGVLIEHGVDDVDEGLVAV